MVASYKKEQAVREKNPHQKQNRGSAVPLHVIGYRLKLGLYIVLTEELTLSEISVSMKQWNGIGRALLVAAIDGGAHPLPPS